ncbi:hypothetical protein NHQ30_009501 [Ciborinia camelliae]|nr:hypothetical protein NHQ30_009501 [Ciborinia camelliae]
MNQSIENDPVQQASKVSLVPKGYAQALEGQIASLEPFITKLIAADASRRDKMLANSTDHLNLQQEQASTSSKSVPSDIQTISIRLRADHLRKVKDGNSAEFYGATSFRQIGPSENLDGTSPSTIPQAGITSPVMTQISNISGGFMEEHLAFAPQRDICKYLMRIFFQNQYQYHLCLYREYFLRDFDVGAGPH